MEPTTKNRFLYIALALLVLLNIVTLGSMWAMRFCGKPQPPFGMHQPPGMQPPFGMQQHPGMPPMKDGRLFLAEELRFTPEQDEKFKKLRDEHFTTSRKLIEEMHKSMDNMMEQIKTKENNDSKAEEYASISSLKHKELQILAYKHFKSIRDICDDKQKEKFDSMLKDITKMMAPPGPPPPER